MPNSLESAVIFALVIAPGYLLVRGFSVGRTHTPPGRDLYVLAEAVLMSIIWLAIVFMVARGRLSDYGLLPRVEAEIQQHGVEIARLVLAIVLIPYAVGRLSGWLSRRGLKTVESGVHWVDDNVPVAGGSRRDAWLRWSAGVLRQWAALAPPTVWDRAWTARRASDMVTVHLKDGLIVRGPVQRVDLSPSPHQIVLESGFGFDDNGVPLPLADGPSGIYLDGAEIRAVFFD